MRQASRPPLTTPTVSPASPSGAAVSREGDSERGGPAAVLSCCMRPVPCPATAATSAASGEVEMAREYPTRIPLRRTAEEQAEEDRFLALYGAWSALSPAELAPELAGFNRPWWVVGGWAIEAATGFRREHEDTDISILACDVPAFVAHMSDRWHGWKHVGGVLHPLGDRWLTVDEPDSQLWLRGDRCCAVRGDI